MLVHQLKDPVDNLLKLSWNIFFTSISMPLTTVVKASSLKLIGALVLKDEPSVVLTREKYWTARPLTPQRLFHHWRNEG